MSVPGKDRESSPARGSLYHFGQFALHSHKRTLSRADSSVSLTPRAFDVLLFLAQNPNRLVTKEELLQAVWGDTFVEEGNLTQYISHLRKALGDNSEDPCLIVTIARKGYQFTGDVTVGEADTAKLPATAVQTAITDVSLPDTLSTKTDGQVSERQLRAPKHWRKVTAVGVFALVLVFVGYVSWQHFRNATLAPSGKIMLAVLPFQNLTGDPNKEYLADGLTEQMISRLSQLEPDRLAVISRTSVMGYKHGNQRLDQIGRDLSVEYVLENSFRESGGRFRLTAQLVRVKDQTHLWAKDYDYLTKDFFTVEDDVAKSVAQQIELRLISQQQAALLRERPANPDAFDAYMQGFYFFERNTDEDTNRAAKCYERAVQLDPSYALAWAGLSRTRHWQAARGLIPLDEGRRLAREAVVRALELNPNLATAHIQMGRIKRQDDFDWVGADDSTQRGLALAPANPESLRLAAFSKLILGRFDEALPPVRRAVELDPLNAESWETLAEIQFYIGQLDEAETSEKWAVELKNDLSFSHSFLSQIYILQGRPQDALPEIDQVQKYAADWGLQLRALACHALGQRKESDAALTELSATDQKSGGYGIARVYAFRNQPDDAFRWLDRAYAQHNDGLIYTKIDPFLKNLHNDPRYTALLKKLNLPN